MAARTPESSLATRGPWPGTRHLIKKPNRSYWEKCLPAAGAERPSGPRWMFRGATTERGNLRTNSSSYTSIVDIIYLHHRFPIPIAEVIVLWWQCWNIFWMQYFNFMLNLFFFNLYVSALMPKLCIHQENSKVLFDEALIGTKLKHNGDKK